MEQDCPGIQFVFTENGTLQDGEQHSGTGLLRKAVDMSRKTVQPYVKRHSGTE